MDFEIAPRSSEPDRNVNHSHARDANILLCRANISSASCRVDTRFSTCDVALYVGVREFVLDGASASAHVHCHV